MVLDQRSQGAFSNQRHIAAKNQHIAGKISKSVFGAQHRVPCAELSFLHQPIHAIAIIARIGPAHGLGAMADYHRHARRAKSLSGP